jgi:hypothetical protein
VTSNRLQLARRAVRPALKARAMLSGPPGAGKTRTGLIVAELLAEDAPVLVVDTEKESALTYADDFTFDHLPWEPPFEPRALGATITEAGNQYGVVMIDSASHFWRGDGGTLDIAGGKFTGWKDARPAQLDLVEAILGCKAHVIVCSRSKVEHVQEVENGRHVVKKLGMAVIQDDDLEYELNVALELDMDHSMTVSKSRTVAVPVGRVFKSGHAEDFAAAYRDWLKGGEPPAPQAVVDELLARIQGLNGNRRECKAEFLARLGRPEHLRESQIGEAEALVAEFERRPDPPVPPPGSPATTDPPPTGPGGGGAQASRPDDVRVAEDEPQSPPEPTGSNCRQGEEAPASSPEAARLSPIDLARLADQAFPITKDDVPPRKLTWTKKRYRYTLTAAVTDGRTVHLDELTADEAIKLAGRFRDLIRARVEWEALEDGLRIGARVLPWVDPDTATVAV